MMMFWHKPSTVSWAEQRASPALLATTTEYSSWSSKVTSVMVRLQLPPCCSMKHREDGLSSVLPLNLYARNVQVQVTSHSYTKLQLSMPRHITASDHLAVGVGSPIALQVNFTISPASACWANNLFVNDGAYVISISFSSMLYQTTQ